MASDRVDTGRVRRVRAVRRQRVGVRAALRGAADGAPRGRRRRRRPPAQRAGVGHRVPGARVPPRRRPERPHVGHRRAGPRPAARRHRPARARALRRRQGGSARSDRQRRRRGGGDPGAGAGCQSRHRDVAGRDDDDRAGPPGTRAGARDGARRHHAGRDGGEGQGDHRLRQRAGVVPQLRGSAEADDGAQPDALGGVAAAGDPAQRRAARGRLVGVALRPPPPGRSERRRR